MIEQSPGTTTINAHPIKQKMRDYYIMTEYNSTKTYGRHWNFVNLGRRMESFFRHVSNAPWALPKAVIFANYLGHCSPHGMSEQRWKNMVDEWCDKGNLKISKPYSTIDYTNLLRL